MQQSRRRAAELMRAKREELPLTFKLIPNDSPIIADGTMVMKIQRREKKRKIRLANGIFLIASSLSSVTENNFLMRKFHSLSARLLSRCVRGVRN